MKEEEINKFHVVVISKTIFIQDDLSCESDAAIRRNSGSKRPNFN